MDVYFGLEYAQATACAVAVAIFFGRIRIDYRPVREGGRPARSAP